MFLLIVPSSNFSLAFFQRLSYRIWASHFFPLSAMESEVPLSLGNPMVFQQNFFLSTERDFTDPLPQICCFPHLCGWLHKYRSFWHPRPRSVITAIKRRMLNFISQLMQRYVMLLSFPKVYHLFDLSKETRKRKHMKMKSRSFNRLQRR